MSIAVCRSCRAPCFPERVMRPGRVDDAPCRRTFIRAGQRRLAGVLPHQDGYDAPIVGENLDLDPPGERELLEVVTVEARLAVHRAAIAHDGGVLELVEDIVDRAVHGPSPP